MRYSHDSDQLNGNALAAFRQRNAASSRSGGKTLPLPPSATDSSVKDIETL